MPRSKTQEVDDAERESQVLSLRKAGMTFAQIAASLGYSDHSGAKHAYDRAMKKSKPAAR